MISFASSSRICSHRKRPIADPRFPCSETDPAKIRRFLQKRLLLHQNLHEYFYRTAPLPLYSDRLLLFCRYMSGYETIVPVPAPIPRFRFPPLRLQRCPPQRYRRPRVKKVDKISAPVNTALSLFLCLFSFLLIRHTSAFCPSLPAAVFSLRFPSAAFPLRSTPARHMICRSQLSPAAPQQDLPDFCFYASVVFCITIASILHASALVALSFGQNYSHLFADNSCLLHGSYRICRIRRNG